MTQTKVEGEWLLRGLAEEELPFLGFPLAVLEGVDLIGRGHEGLLRLGVQ